MIRIVIQKTKAGKISRRTNNRKSGEYNTLQEAIDDTNRFISEMITTPAPEPIILEIWPYHTQKRI